MNTVCGLLRLLVFLPIIEDLTSFNSSNCWVKKLWINYNSWILFQGIVQLLHRLTGMLALDDDWRYN